MQSYSRDVEALVHFWSQHGHVTWEVQRQKFLALLEDPDEPTNLVDSRPEQLERMRDLAARWELRLAESRAQVEQGIEVALPEDEVKRLRALGYLQ